jgi:putative transposase
MPDARPISPGITYLLTRRCIERRFLFTPDPDRHMARIFGYCLAVASERYGILVHASVTLSNHWHLVVTDVRGNLPEFLRDVHSLIARCVNARYRRCENVWAVRQPSAVHLLDTGIIWEKLVYCLANAVSSWLVASHHAWPGFHTLPDALTNGPKVYARPTEYFSTRTQLPDTATLVITKPPALAHLSDDDYVAQLKKRVAAKESGLNKRSRDGKRPFLGVTAIMAQDPHGHPQTPRPQNEVNPRVAASDPEIRKAALGLLADFLHLYAKARDKWSKGNRRVRFPRGTYQLFHSHAVRLSLMPAPT